jgi:MFS transporter, ACS family, glucarate transporter
MGSGHIRYRVVSFTVALAGVTYLDRACIGVLAPSIMADLKISQIQMGFVFSAFTLAYASLEIPTAWWADRIGSRRVLTRIVLWWSAFTMLTGAATSYVVLLAVRFLFGAGEAGAWPNAARVFSRWVPERERGRVQGIFFAGAHLAAGLTPAIVVWITLFLPWRMVFVALGFVGITWAALWYWWFRDEPKDHPAVSAEERGYIESTRGLPPAHEHESAWYDVFRTPSLVPLCVQYVANCYGAYFLMTWLPTYLIKARAMSTWESAFFSGLPFVLSAVADVVGGVTTDALTRRFGLRIGACSVGFVSYALATAAMLAGTLSGSPRVAGSMIAIGGALSMLTLAPSWMTTIHLGGRRAASLSATMNSAGQFGAFFSPIVLAALVQKYGDWRIPLHVVSGLYLLGAISWLVIRPERRLDSSRRSELQETKLVRETP